MALKDKIKRIKELTSLFDIRSIVLDCQDVTEMVLNGFDLERLDYPDSIGYCYTSHKHINNCLLIVNSDDYVEPLKFVEFEKIEDRRNEKKEKFEIDATVNDGKVVKAIVERDVDFVYAGTIGDSSIPNGLKDDYTPVESEWEFIELNAYDIDGDLLTLSDVQEWVYKEMIINKL